MHLSEFKAWFTGYTEEMKGTPTKDQWAKIKKRVSEISNDYTPMPVFVDRYWQPLRPFWSYNTVYCNSTTPTVTSNGGTGETSPVYSYNLSQGDWTELGRAEFKAEAA